MGRLSDVASPRYRYEGSRSWAFFYSFRWGSPAPGGLPCGSPRSDDSLICSVILRHQDVGVFSSASQISQHPVAGCAGVPLGVRPTGLCRCMCRTCIHRCGGKRVGLHGCQSVIRMPALTICDVLYVGWSALNLMR